MGYDPARERERHLAKAYAAFEKEARIAYGRETAKQRLKMVRQFCKFLVDGSPPKKSYPPRPPRP